MHKIYSILLTYYLLFTANPNLSGQAAQLAFPYLPRASFQSSNLVLNGSFEDTLGCPYFAGDIDSAQFWFEPYKCSSDYFNPCTTDYAGVPYNFAGYQNPRSESAYAGLRFYNEQGDREYIETMLTIPLIANKKYCIGFYVTLSDKVKYATDAIHALLTTDSVKSLDCFFIPKNPQIKNPPGNIIQDTINWSLVSGEYIALGGERFITIGNFYSNSSTQVIIVNPLIFDYNAYYYIDDISVYEMEELPSGLAGAAQTICATGDSILIGVPPIQGYQYVWQAVTGIQDTTTAQPKVKPAQTTAYILTVIDTTPKPYSCKPTTTDTVVVYVQQPQYTAQSGLAGTDSVLCKGDTALIGKPPLAGYSYNWQAASTLSGSTTAQPLAFPQQTTTYFLTATNNADSGFCKINTAGDSVIVSVVVPAQANAGSDASLCKGASVQIGSAPVAGYKYLWQPGTGLNDSAKAQPAASPAQTTYYALTVRDTGNVCPPITDSATLFVVPPSFADAGSDKIICRNLTTAIGAASSVAGYTYNWLPATGLSNPNSPQPVFSHTETTILTLTVRDTAKACPPATDAVTVTVNPCDTPNVLYIPNMFSPNGDGQNDVFRIHGVHIKEAYIVVYNRWGAAVFEDSSSPLPSGEAGGLGWDGTHNGKPLNSGVFVYFARVTFANGETQELKGNVTLVR